MKPSERLRAQKGEALQRINNMMGDPDLPQELKNELGDLRRKVRKKAGITAESAIGRVDNIWESRQTKGARVRKDRKQEKARQQKAEAKAEAKAAAKEEAARLEAERQAEAARQEQERAARVAAEMERQRLAYAAAAETRKAKEREQERQYNWITEGEVAAMLHKKWEPLLLALESHPDKPGPIIKTLKSALNRLIQHSGEEEAHRQLSKMQKQVIAFVDNEIAKNSPVQNALMRMFELGIVPAAVIFAVVTFHLTNGKKQHPPPPKAPPIPREVFEIKPDQLTTVAPEITREPLGPPAPAK